MKKSIPIIIGLLLVIAFFWNNLFGPAVNITPEVGTNDLTDLNFPFRHFLSESLGRGEIPLWSADISSGYPILAEGQIGGLYPLNLAFALFPTLASINLTIISTYFFLFLFSYLYLRRIKLSYLASTFGAVLVAFSGFAANELLHLGMLISFYLFIGQLYFLESFIKSGKPVWVLGMGLLLGVSILGGHPQIIFYSMLVLFLYWLILWLLKKKSILTLIIYVVLFVAIGLGVGAGQFLPQMEFTRNSTRATGLTSESIGRYSLPFSDIATFVSPFSTYSNEHTLDGFAQNGWPKDEKYVYMGILGLVFALLGVIAVVKNRKFFPYGYFFIIASVFALLLSFGSQLTFGKILTLPPFSFFRIPFRLIFIVNLSFAVLAAHAVDEIEEWLMGKKLNNYLIFGIFGILLAILFFDLRVNAKRLHPEVDAKAWYEEPEVTSFLKERLADQERVTSQQYFYPSIKIFLEDPDLWDNYQTFINLHNLTPIFNNLLYDIPKNIGAANSAGIKIGRYNELESEIYFGGIEYEDLDAPKLTDSFLFLNRIMGVRYLLITRPIESFILSKVHQIDFDTGQDSVYIYEFFDYFPRTFMVPKAEKAEPSEIKQHLMDGDFDPKRKVFVEEDVDWGAQGGFAATTQFEKYSDQEVTIGTQASGDGFLYLSDTYYPGWKAYVDGEEAKIYRANYAFRVVQVPEGEHTVTFKYEPESFYWGVRITMGTAVVALLGIVGLLIFGKQKKQ